MVGAARPSQDTGLYTVTGIPSTENTDRFLNFRTSDTAVWPTLFLLNVSVELMIIFLSECFAVVQLKFEQISFLPQNVDEMANPVDLFKLLLFREAV